ncbi:MAG: HlyC/CorC family transporter, partial [Clostridiales bacterium]|nr:HlyC/CorC family transporter [Clostridiales bacterium]
GFAESFAYKIGGIYGFFLWLFSPIALISTGLVNLVLKLFRIDSSGARDSVTEEEILMMVDAVNETGGIEESQKEMINNIFEFDDLEVKDVMTHRTSLLAVELNDPILDAVKIATEDGFSRIPVYNETIDNICGVLFAKDLLKLAYAGNEKEYKISDIMREIKYVPESNYCSELFKEFTLNKNQIAVVVDEYGGTAGIVSMEDLIEAIVGNIQDEYDNEEEEIQEITPNTFDLLGTTGFDDAMDEMGIDYPEDNDYDTIGGFVIDLLGRYPEKDESPTVKYKNVVFTVIKSEDKKIQKLRALKINKENAQNTEI